MEVRQGTVQRRTSRSFQIPAVLLAAVVRCWLLLVIDQGVGFQIQVTGCSKNGISILGALTRRVCFTSHILLYRIPRCLNLSLDSKPAELSEERAQILSTATQPKGLSYFQMERMASCILRGRTERLMKSRRSVC